MSALPESTRVARLVIEGHKGLHASALLGPVTLVTGANGSGKSRVLEALAMVTGSAPIGAVALDGMAGERTRIVAELDRGAPVELLIERGDARLRRPQWSQGGHPVDASIWGRPLPISGPALVLASERAAADALAAVCAQLPGAEGIISRAVDACVDAGVEVDGLTGDHARDVEELLARARTALRERRREAKALAERVKARAMRLRGPAPSIDDAERAVEAARRARDELGKPAAQRGAGLAREDLPCGVSPLWLGAHDPWAAPVDLCAACPAARGVRPREPEPQGGPDPEAVAAAERALVDARRAHRVAVERADAAAQAQRDPQAQREAAELVRLAEGAVDALEDLRAELLRLGAASIEEAAADAMPEGWRARIIEGRPSVEVACCVASGAGLSGAQRVALGIALHVALLRTLGGGPGARMLCVELDELDDTRAAEVLGRLRRLYDDGHVGQVVAARWRFVDVDGVAVVEVGR